MGSQQADTNQPVALSIDSEAVGQTRKGTEITMKRDDTASVAGAPRGTPATPAGLGKRGTQHRPRDRHRSRGQGQSC